MNLYCAHCEPNEYAYRPDLWRAYISSVDELTSTVTFKCGHRVSEETIAEFPDAFGYEAALR